MSMENKCIWSMRLYKFYVGRGMDRPTALVTAIDNYASNWREYVSIYDMIKDSL